MYVGPVLRVLLCEFAIKNNSSLGFVDVSRIDFMYICLDRYFNV